MRLNLACGDIILGDYINCDLYNPLADKKCDVTSLPFKDNSVEEILAQHIIEHFAYPEAQLLLKEWHRVLEDNGKLIIETPDFLESCKKFIAMPENEQYKMYGHFFAKPWVDGETHKFLYTKGELWNILNNAGFKNITFEEPTVHLANPNLRAISHK